MFFYFGRKSSLGRCYPQPILRTVVEPFAGSAAYAHRYIRTVDRVVLVELDVDVVTMWRQLLDPALHVDDICPPCTFGVDTTNLFHLAAAVSGGGRYRHLKATPIMAENIERLRRQLPAARRHWQAIDVEIIHGDYTLAPDIEATWFIDPPYRGHQGSLYPHGSKDIDYDALGAWCRTRAGQVIVCESEGADWLPFQPLARLVSVRGKRSHEAVYLNGEPGLHGRLL